MWTTTFLAYFTTTIATKEILVVVFIILVNGKYDIGNQQHISQIIQGCDAENDVIYGTYSS